MAGKNLVLTVLFAGVFALGYVAGSGNSRLSWQTAQAEGQARVYELRTYTSHEGKLQDIVNRFRDHTRTYFDRHGMSSVGYWTPQDGPTSQNTLIYILARIRAAMPRKRTGTRSAPIPTGRRRATRRRSTARSSPRSSPCT